MKLEAAKNPSRSKLMTSLVQLYHEREQRIQPPGQPSADWQWLASSRENLFRQWQALELPSSRQERWRYTDTQKLWESEALPPGIQQDQGPFEEAGADKFAYEIAIVDGVFSSRHSRLPTDGSVEVLSEHAKAVCSPLHVQLAKLEVGREPVSQERILSSINHSLFQDLITIVVQKSLAGPLGLSLYTSQKGDANRWAFSWPRVLVKLAAGQEAVIGERQLATQTKHHWSNSVIQYVLAEDSRLELMRLQDSGEDNRLFQNIAFHQAKNSSVQVTSAIWGGGFCRNEMDVFLEGEDASVSLSSIGLLHGQGQADHLISIRHMAPRTKSEQLVKAVLAEESKSFYGGSVHIQKGAVQSDARQLGHSLLLGKRAESNSKPELFIDVDDVKASHGVAVGSLDLEQIFYLQARGLERKTARRILIEGYVEEVALRGLRPGLKEWMRAEVQAKMRTFPFAEEGDHA